MNILSRAWPRLSSQQENQPALGSFLSTSSFALSLFESVFRLPMVSSFLFLFPIPLSHAFSSSPVLPRFLIYRVGQLLSLSLSFFSVVNAVSVVSGRLSLSLSLSPPASRLPVSSPLFSVALERAYGRSIRFQETWKNEFGERDSSISVSAREEHRGTPSVNEWDIVNGIDYQNGTIIAAAIIRPRSPINNTLSPSPFIQ